MYNILFTTGATTSKKVRTTRKRHKSSKMSVKGQSTKLKVKPKGSQLKARLAADDEMSDDDTVEWNQDGDFKTDILSSARKATIMNSGSITKLKPVQSVRQHRQKVRRLVYDSDKDDQSEDDEWERERNTRTRVPSRFILSDDDD